MFINLHILCKVQAQLHSFACGCQFSQHYMLKPLTFPHGFGALLKTFWPYIQRFVSGLSILFHCSVCIYENTTLLITVWKRDSLSVVSDSLPPIDCSPPGSSAHGIFQARILEWVFPSPGKVLPFPSLGVLLNPGIEPVSYALAGGFFTAKPPGSPQYSQ